MILFLMPITASAYRNEPNGFRDLQWGTNFKTVKNQMVYDSTSVDGTIKYYNRKNDDLTLVNIKLEYIAYGFSHNQFVRVEIKPLAYVDQPAKAFKWIEETYGDYSSADFNSMIAFWEGQVTNIVFRLPGDEPCIMVLSSTKLQ